MKIKKSHRLYLALLILLFVFKTAAIHYDITNLNYQKNSPTCGYAIEKNEGNEHLEVGQANGQKVWMFLCGAIEYKAPWIKKLIFIILVSYIFLHSVVDIDIRRKIQKFNALRFNGSKYKEGCVLPQF